MATESSLAVIPGKITESAGQSVISGQASDYTRVVLLGILALGLSIRLIHFQTLVDTAFLKIPLIYTQSDMYAYWQWAQTILAGDILGRDTYHPYFEWMQAIAPLETWYRWWGGQAIFQQAPLYPYWLASILALSKSSIEVVIFAQLVLGALHPLVMYALTRRLFNVSAGLVAAALTAWYGPFIFEQGAFSRDWVSPLLEPLALLTFLKAQSSGQRRDWCLAGAVLGLALLAKETILLFLPFACIWLLVTYRGALSRAIPAAGFFLLGLLLMLSPLILRNVLVGAPPLSVSNRTAEGLIEGHAADGFPLGLFHPPSMQAILERSEGRTLPVIQEILQTYNGQPYRFVELQLLKLRGIADPFEIPNNLNFLYGLEISPALRWTLGYGMIGPLAVVGFFCALPRWREHLLVALFGLATLGSLMSTIVLGRYRLLLVPVLIIYAAFGVVTVIDTVRRQHLAMGAALLALIMGVAWAQNGLVPIPLLRKVPEYSIHGPSYILSARIYAAESRFERALEELGRLREHAGHYSTDGESYDQISLYAGDYRVAWAMQLLDDAEPAAAREQLTLAEAAYASHLHLGRPHYQLGRLYLKLSDMPQARALLERSLELEPEGDRATHARELLATIASERP